MSKCCSLSPCPFQCGYAVLACVYDGNNFVWDSSHLMVLDKFVFLHFDHKGHHYIAFGHACRFISSRAHKKWLPLTHA